MCVPTAVAAAAITAAASVGSSAISARAQARASRRIARTQEDARRAELRSQRQEFERRQAGAPDSAPFLEAARKRAMQGLGATFLTGPQGAVVGAKLGQAKLLGGGTAG